jgi:ribosomal RNA-processing protein 12
LFPRGGAQAGKEHTGDRFRAKKAEGDVSRQGGVQPYAYWPMDAKLLNRREAKKRDARKGLDRVVSAAKAGARAAAPGRRR